MGEMDACCKGDAVRNSAMFIDTDMDRGIGAQGVVFKMKMTV